MERKKIPGLYKRGGLWHIDKQVRGRRICESTGESDLTKAEEYLARRIEEIRQATVYGVRPRRTFRQAATKYLMDVTKRSLARDEQDLKLIDLYVVDLYLDQVHMGTLQKFINERRAQGVKSVTVNRTLAVVRRVLNLAARLWRDEHGLTWLETPPMILLQDWEDQRLPYPLSWNEQSLLFRHLPTHLAKMALFQGSMGGGKTHSLSAFALLAEHPSVRQRVAPGLQPLARFDSVKTVVFNGVEWRVPFELKPELASTPEGYTLSVRAHPVNAEVFVTFDGTSPKDRRPLTKSQLVPRDAQRIRIITRAGGRWSEEVQLDPPHRTRPEGWRCGYP